MQTKLYISMFGDKILFRTPTPFKLSTLIHFFLFGWVHSMLAAFSSRDTAALESLTFWDRQGNPGLLVTASQNDLSRPSFRTIPDSCLSSASFLNLRRKLCSPFLLCLTPVLCDRYRSDALGGWNMAPMFKYIFTSFLFFTA